MTVKEQIAQERAAVIRLTAQLAQCMAELAAAEAGRERTMESVCAITHARLGVSSAQRLLKAHEDSLARIFSRAERERPGRAFAPPRK